MLCVQKTLVQGRYKTVAVAFATVLALGAALATPAPAMTVTDDRGGSVSARMRQVAQLSARGTEVRITGTCISACTLFLGVPNACVSPSARLGFHGPSTRTSGLPLPRAEYERISLQMAAMYPPALRQWFITSARAYTEDYVLITGQDAIAMGARRCD